MNQKLLSLSRSRTDSDESGDESAAGTKRRYLLATIGLAGAVFLARRWSGSDDVSATDSEQTSAEPDTSGGGLSRRLKAMVVGTVVLALVRYVRRRRSGTPAH